jgi:hypothetical protein
MVQMPTKLPYERAIPPAVTDEKDDRAFAAERMLMSVVTRWIGYSRLFNSWFWKHRDLLAR